MRLNHPWHAAPTAVGYMSVCLCRHKKHVRGYAADKTCARTHVGRPSSTSRPINRVANTGDLASQPAGPTSCGSREDGRLIKQAPGTTNNQAVASRRRTVFMYISIAGCARALTFY